MVPYVYVYCFSLNLIVGVSAMVTRNTKLFHMHSIRSPLSLGSATPTYNRGSLIHLLFFVLFGFHFAVQELETFVVNTTPGFFTRLDTSAHLSVPSATQLHPHPASRSHPSQVQDIATMTMEGHAVVGSNNSTSDAMETGT